MVADTRIMTLISKKQALSLQLKSLVYGSIEIRERGEKKYIYAHRRELGRMVTDFVGEYSEELFDSVNRNNTKAKALNKEIKAIQKELDEANYTETVLPDNIKRNIDFAKRNLVDSIYTQAVLEGVATTYAVTEDIIAGAKVSDMAPEDIIKIVNLKHAWEFILNESVIQSEYDLALVCQINKLVLEGFYYNAGKLRDVPVKIGGSSWAPEMPIESIVKESLTKILEQHDSAINIAIDLLLYVMRSQLFIDGNKRTAVIFANHYLISKGKGIISIPPENIEEFKNLLIEHYETGQKTNIANFLTQNCYQPL